MSAQAQTFDDFVFPDATPAEDNLPPGMYPATLTGYEKPTLKTFDDGTSSESMKLIWRLDEDPDREQWSFINPKARSEKANFYKAYKALTGQPLQQDTVVRMAQLLNRRCQLMMVENEKKAGYTRVGGYAPIAKAPRPLRPAPAPVAALLDADPFDVDEVPFD